MGLAFGKELAQVGEEHQRRGLRIGGASSRMGAEGVRGEFLRGSFFNAESQRALR